MIGQSRPARAKASCRDRPGAGRLRPGRGAMQLPTEPTHGQAATAMPAGRTGDEAELYRHYHRDLMHAVSGTVQRQPEADRGRLPDRLDHPAPTPTRPPIGVCPAMHRCPTQGLIAAARSGVNARAAGRRSRVCARAGRCSPSTAASGGRLRPGFVAPRAPAAAAPWPPSTSRGREDRLYVGVAGDDVVVERRREEHLLLGQRQRGMTA